MNFFEATVSSICHAIASGHDTSLSSSHAGPYNDVTHFVLEQHRAMSSPLRAAIWIATIGVAMLPFLSRGKDMKSLSRLARQDLLSSWRASRLAPLRDLARFYDSLTVLCLYSRNEETK